LGLLVDDRLELAKGLVDHFVFQIRHYGKVLNGSRSYYLCRSQPPFLTDMALQIFVRLDPDDEEENMVWLRKAIAAAMKEYHTYWMSDLCVDPITGLSRYRPIGEGIPTETEASHFIHILQPFAKKHGISVNEFTERYNDGIISELELDEYLLHDRAVRESGHDTTYRLEGRCADLATIDLNSLLFKYEIDIANAIRDVYDDHFELEEDFPLSPFPFGEEAKKLGVEADKKRPTRSTQGFQTSKEWFARAALRKQLLDRFCWNEQKGLFFDYDTKQKKQSEYETVTSFFSLWAGLASRRQASRLIIEGLPKFEANGGLVPGTAASRGPLSEFRPERQWDYPIAWAPHNMIAWCGLERYGYLSLAERCAYRWLYMMTTTFVDFSGIVCEKYDAVKMSHQVDAEYGNQGVDIEYVPREGFGWSSASYQCGLQYLSSQSIRALGALIPPEALFVGNRRGVKAIDPDLSYTHRAAMVSELANLRRRSFHAESGSQPLGP